MSSSKTMTSTACSAGDSNGTTAMTMRPSKKHIKEICKLANHLSEYESIILHRRRKLSLTASVLSAINSSLDRLYKQLDSLQWDPSVGYTKSDFHSALSFLLTFFHRVRDVQITEDTCGGREQLDLSNFHNIHSLELKKVSFDLVTGLDAIQNRLQEFMCHYCAISLTDFIRFNSTALDSVCLWTSLQKIVVVRSGITELAGALRAVPSLKHLDLSYNCLSDASEIQFLINLEYLNLSYNSLKTMPPFSSLAVRTLKTLLLQHNRIETLQGLQELPQLNELDLRYNCLIYQTALEPLSRLLKLQSLWLFGNPLSYATGYRLLVIQCLHPSSLHTYFHLDGKQLTKKEIAKVQNVGNRGISRSAKSCPGIAGQGVINAVSEEQDTISSRSLGSQSCLLSGDVVHSEISTISPNATKQENLLPVRLRSRSRKPREAVIVDLTEDDSTLGEHLKPMSATESALKSASGSPSISATILNTASASDTESKQSRSPLAEQLYLPLQLQVKDDEREEIGLVKNEDLDPMVSKISVGRDLEEQSEVAVEMSQKDSTHTGRDPRDDDNTVLADVEEHGELVVLKEENDDDDSDTKVLLDFSKLPAKSEEGAYDDDVREIAEPLSPIYTKDEPHKYALHEDVSEERLFLAQQYVGEELLDILLIVGEQRIQEIDGLTGSIKDVLDLKTLKSVTHSLTSKGMFEVSLFFDPPRRKPQRKAYIVENDETLQSLESLLKPFTQVQEGPTLQCLKCSIHLKKHETKHVILQATEQGDMNEMEVCPNCGSTALVDLEDNDASSMDDKKELSTRRSSSPTTVEKQIKCLINLTLNDDDDDDKSAADSESSATSDTALLTVPGGRKISGSDITILSNPSQSSIVRIPEPGSDPTPGENALDIILESPAHSPRPCSSMDDYSGSIYDDNPAVTERQSLLSESSIETLLNSQELISLSYEKKHRLDRLGSSTAMPPCKVTKGSGGGDDGFSRAERPTSESRVMDSAKGSSDDNKSSSELWNELLEWRKITYDNFVVIDHRLRLYLEVSVLDDGEEFEGLLKASIMLKPFREEWPGYLVLSTKKIYLFRILNNQGNKDDPSTWLQLVSSRSVEQLRRIVILLGSQGFWFEWEKESLANPTKLWQLFLTKDADCCNCFISFFTDLMEKKMRLHHQYEAKVEVVAEEDLADLVQDVICWQPSDQTASSSDVPSSSEVLVFQLVEWKQSTTCHSMQSQCSAEAKFAVCVVTSTDIFVATMKPRIPVTTSSATTKKSKSSKDAEQRFTPQARQSISYLMSVHVRSDLEQVGLHFMDYNERDEILWLITTHSKAGMASLLNTLKTPWENCFQIPMELKATSGCACGV